MNYLLGGALRARLSFMSFGIFVCMSMIPACGFVVEEHATGPYYLIGVDSKHPLTLSYELEGGDYIGRVPDVVMFGFNDTLLVAKSSKENVSHYYIIDKRKDHPYAKEEEYLIAMLTPHQFETEWLHKLNIEMKPIK